TKKVDVFTSRLLDIHARMLQIGKKEDIRLGLHRSDYMLDEKTNLLLQIELNTISCSFSGLSCLVSDLHRSLLSHYTKPLGLNSQKVPTNTSASKFAEVLAKAWTEYNNPSAVVMVVVQPGERNMYDQHWLTATLKEKHNVTTIRKTLAEIDAQGIMLSDGTLQVDGEDIAVIYFRAGYAPTDYPSESEWKARLLVEESSAIKCPSISYHLTGTKKVQQELAKPNVLERFLDNKDDIAKLRACFAGLWSLDDTEAVKNAVEQPEAYVMKPQREGGDGICYKEQAISELGIFSAYLRNKETVISSEQCGYLMRTKVSSSNEGGVAAGFAVLDSLYLT
nr:glutathione synthetase, chloroplastic [Tanacetum cinerariifolium]